MISASRKDGEIMPVQIQLYIINMKFDQIEIAAMVVGLV
jgi:hypothetical protein